MSQHPKRDIFASYFITFLYGSVLRYDNLQRNASNVSDKDAVPFYPEHLPYTGTVPWKHFKVTWVPSSGVVPNKCRLVISVVITQDKEAILKAYNGDDGTKRRFYQYGIVRLNKEEGSVIDLARFTYGIDFVSDLSPGYMSYVRAYIQAKEDMRCPIPGLDIRLVLKKGERIYFHEGAGISCKYTLQQIQNLIHKAGLRLTGTWMDEGKHIAFCQCAVV